MTTSVSGAVSVQGPAQQGSGGSLKMTPLNDKSGIDPAFVKEGYGGYSLERKKHFLKRLIKRK
jgi:hypothetical protein